MKNIVETMSEITMNTKYVTGFNGIRQLERFIEALEGNGFRWESGKPLLEGYRKYIEPRINECGGSCSGIVLTIFNKMVGWDSISRYMQGDFYPASDFAELSGGRVAFKEHEAEKLRSILSERYVETDRAFQIENTVIEKFERNSGAIEYRISAYDYDYSEWYVCDAFLDFDDLKDHLL